MLPVSCSSCPVYCVLVKQTFKKQAPLLKKLWRVFAPRCFPTHISSSAAWSTIRDALCQHLILYLVPDQKARVSDSQHAPHLLMESREITIRKASIPKHLTCCSIAHESLMDFQPTLPLISMHIKEMRFLQHKTFVLPIAKEESFSIMQQSSSAQSLIARLASAISTCRLILPQRHEHHQTYLNIPLTNQNPFSEVQSEGIQHKLLIVAKQLQWSIKKLALSNLHIQHLCAQLHVGGFANTMLIKDH